MSKRKSLDDQIAAQRQWIADHGGDLAGYVARYGTYGDGGAAIYRADRATLDKLLEESKS